MSKAKFTKGEWHVQNVGDNKLSIDSDSGMSLAIISNDYESDVANAHLIAAAPEMYAMLRQMHIEGGLGIDRHSRIDRLLIKARGEKND